jgi:hypothetical protein
MEIYLFKVIFKNKFKTILVTKHILNIFYTNLHPISFQMNLNSIKFE